ncbi:MAG: 1-deoxy-D-xylulose-5-phosphate reductoisomerase [Bacillota bacterium]|nr:1-deoxy-D-xylulose-5-phosphate reductoisomerase [Bacillota bacterium]
MKRISILGSTGSIGAQALELIAAYPDQLKAVALSCSRRTDLLRKQIVAFAPEAVSLAREEDAKAIRAEFPHLEVYWGEDGLKTLASLESADMVLNSLMGMRGLTPTLAAIDAGRDIAFANKETLVAGGELVMDRVRDRGVRLLPVDSEHSAIFQSLEGNEACRLRRILLTASGGPFRGYTRKQLELVELEDALKHPNWTMGQKITIDSATMMNKGLEIIEARWLFDVPLEKIRVLIHPQSVLHSAVEYEDGSVIGQMGNPDMKAPIAYAFSWPRRFPMTGTMRPLDLIAFGTLTFEEPNDEVFRTMTIARQACRQGGTWPVCMNGANEALVDAFLQRKIRFVQIQDLLEEVLDRHQPVERPGLEEILEADRWAREAAESIVKDCC